MRSLRILQVTPYSPEAWAYGGIPRVAGTIARTLVRRGHHVTLCTTDACSARTRLTSPPSQISRFAPWSASRMTDGVVMRVFPNVSNRLAYRHQLFLPRGLQRYLRQHAGTFDIAHIHAHRNVPEILAARELRRAGVPYVIAPNGTAARIERKRLTKQGFDVLIGNRLLRDAAAVLAVSGAERAQLRELGITALAIRLIPNPIDLDEFTRPVSRGHFRRRAGWPANPLVLFLGKLTPRKRLDVLVRAFARLRVPNARLVIAGNDMGAGPSARAIVRELGLESRTRFTGLLEGPDRLEALANADVVVYPSEHEIFGLVPLEAILSGTAVIVADDSGCGEVVRAVGGGIVTPLGDIDALARAIDDVLGAPDRWRAAAADAALRVRALYGQDVIGAQLQNLFGELCGTRARPTLADSPMPRTASTGVSVVVPVRNGGRTIGETLNAIVAQANGRPMEIIVVDDRSDDESRAIVQALANRLPIRVLTGAGRGAAAALNVGIRAARFPIICQVDQDVIVERGWMRQLVGALDDPAVAAAQGYYVSDAGATFFARVMGLDLEQRYDAISGGETTHVCTGNAAYRAAALHVVGLFDETLGYGYDNDMSYRLREAGHRLMFCREARSRHRWREGLAAYLVQQYGFGYGRLDLVAKHPRRWTGDSVSPAGMMLHPVFMLVAAGAAISAMLLASVGAPWRLTALGSAAIVAGLSGERLATGIRAARRAREWTPLAFPFVHALRDAAWVAAIVMWSIRRVTGREPVPAHSMRPRNATAR